MKQDIHPQYYPKAVVTCACGAKHVFGATKEKMTVEICSECHPFYTGKEKLVDTAGRVEKFKSRQKTAETKKETAKAKPVKTAKATTKKILTKKTAAKKATPKSSSKRTTGQEK